MPKEENNIAETTKGILEILLSKMGVVASVIPQFEPAGEGEEEATAPMTFNIKGDDAGILIGRRGQTLSCLQYMVRLIIARQTQSWLPITLDVDDYKQRRYETLQAFAWQMAEQVQAKEAPFTLEPMRAYERRIIHLTLADNPNVTTQSTGEGEFRRVTISLKGQADE